MSLPLTPSSLSSFLILLILLTNTIEPPLHSCSRYLSVFAKALPLEVAARVWDCYLAEGELFATKLSLGILRLYAPRLCNLKTEGIMTFLMHLPQVQSLPVTHLQCQSFSQSVYIYSNLCAYTEQKKKS